MHLSRDWERILPLVPSSAKGALLSSFDRLAPTSIAEMMDELYLPSSLSAFLSDALGIDLADPQATIQLGLDPRGDLAAFLYRDLWIVIAEVSRPSSTAEALDRLEHRNPDLVMSRRALDGLRVLAIRSSSNPSLEARLHLALSRDHLVVVFDGGSIPVPTIVDEALCTIQRGGWGQNILFNPRFAEALRAAPEGAVALWFFEVASLLSHLPGGARYPADQLSSSSLIRSAEQCHPLQSRVGEVLPYFYGSVFEQLEPSGDLARPNLRASHDWYWVVAPAWHEQARALLPPFTINPASLVDETTLLLALSVDPAVFAEAFSDFVEAGACHGGAALLGHLGEVAQVLEHHPELPQLLDGNILAALFELRNVGQIPYPDVMLLAGSPSPNALTSSLAEAFRSELGVAGVVEQRHGLNVIDYRIALLYRVALITGQRAVALTMGRIPDRHLLSLLDPPAEDQAASVFLFLDGPRLSSNAQRLNELMIGQSTQAHPLAQLLQLIPARVSNILSSRLTIQYRDGLLRAEVEHLRRP